MLPRNVAFACRISKFKNKKVTWLLHLPQHSTPMPLYVQSVDMSSTPPAWVVGLVDDGIHKTGDDEVDGHVVLCVEKTCSHHHPDDTLQ
jgi:hypothetical protein